MTIELKNVLGLDIGTKRTGFARASMVAKIPEPLAVVETDKAVLFTQKTIKQLGIDALVVGIPTDMSGKQTQQTIWTEQWANQLAAQLELPIFRQDETATTEAAKQLTATYPSHSDQLDALAACVILQDFLMTPVDKRQVL